jgi:general secretion pathway protein D
LKSLPHRLLGAAAVAVLLAGCAAQTAYREGLELVNAGRYPEGLARLEEAQRLDPTLAQYRVAVLQARERYLQLHLDRAETLRRDGKTDEAEAAYRQVLALQGTNDRALNGLRALDQQRRTDAWLREAEAAAAKGDVDGARTKLRAIQLDAPGHEGARALARKVEDTLARPAPETSLGAAYRKPITIDFKDVPLKTVFEVVSRTSGLNFLFDKDVRTDQKTSIFLKNSTVENVVNLTLLTNQLEQRVLDANTVLIYPNTQAKQKDYQPLTVKSFYLANAEAKTVAATIKALLKSRDVVVDDKLNLVILRDSPEAVRLAEKLVALHDVPEPEVMMEVEILEVKRTRLLDLGIRWPDQLSLTPLPSTSGGVLTLADLRHISSATTGVGVGPITLSAKKVDTDANILANPRIRARNREKAKVLIGERVPNITTTSTSTGFVAESVNYVDVGLKLEVEPTIYLDGEVAIKVSLEVSNIISQVQTKSGSVAYQIGTRTAQTVLRLKDGENQVLAGLINDEDRRSANKVPGLGEVPVVGRLFGNQADDNSKTEIVLSITPRVLRNVRRPEGPLIEFESGTENSLGMRPTVAPAVAAPQGTPGILPVPAVPVVPVVPAVPGAPGPASALPPGTAGAAAAGPAAAVAGAATTATRGDTAAAASAGSPASSAAAEAATAPNPANSPPPAAASGPASFRLQGPAQVKVGETFSLQLAMQSDQPVVSVPLALSFDPRMLQAVSVQEGEFLRQGGAQTSFASRVDPSGQVLMTGTRSGDGGATTIGNFVTVTFRAAAAVAPETRVQLLTAAPVGLGGRSIPAAPATPFVLRVGNP